MALYLTRRLLAHLALIAADRVTYKPASRGRSYRVWASSDDNERRYVTATPIVRTLIDAGLARQCSGWRYDRGTVELTHDGHVEVERRMAWFWQGLASWR